MYLAPEGHEVEIAEATASFLAKTMPIARLHAPDSADMSAPLRHTMGDKGWFGLAVPERQGGSGLSAVEHALFFREAGRQCSPIDLLTQSLAANAVVDSGLRASIMSGERGVALVVADGTGWRVLGNPGVELGLHVTAETTSIVPLSTAGAQPRASLDPANSLAWCEGLPDPVARIEGDRPWRLGQLGAAAMLVGMAEAALDLIVAYARVRETFGRKIGAWQAVRHPLADMAVRTEAARAQLWYAAVASKENRGDAAAHLVAAKHLANETALGNCDTSIQLHGGIGVTDEHDCHLLLKHALVLSRLFGARRALLCDLLHASLED